MAEVLSKLVPGDLAALLSIMAIGGIVGTIALVGLIIRSADRSRARKVAESVVLEMLDRGMTTEEIVAVLKAMDLDEADGLPRRRQQKAAKVSAQA